MFLRPSAASGHFGSRGMLRTGSGGGGLQVAPASPGGGFARTVSSTELGGAEYVTDARCTAGRQKHDRHAKSRGGALPEASRAFVAKLAVCALACLAALAALVLVGTLRGADSETRRLIVFDAGSSSTRVHVFELDVARRGSRLPTVRAHFEAPRRASPGLAEFAADTDHDVGGLPDAKHANETRDEQMEAYLGPLLRFAESVVPKSLRAETRTLFMATAGVRALPPAQQARALERCRSVLNRIAFGTSPERLQNVSERTPNVRVITGADEGLYGWIAANYAAGTLYDPPTSTVGVVELGGASAQVTFRPETKPPRAYRAELVVADRKWAVYTHSALGLGLDAARRAYERRARDARAAEAAGNASSSGKKPGLGAAPPATTLVDPCALAGSEPLGSPVGKGDFAACRAACAELMGARQNDQTLSATGFGGSFLPPLRGSFLLTENFAHTARFLRDAGFLDDPESAPSSSLSDDRHLTTSEGSEGTDDDDDDDVFGAFGLDTRTAAPYGHRVGHLSIARVADAGRSICSTSREALSARLAERSMRLVGQSKTIEDVEDEADDETTETTETERTQKMLLLERGIRDACFATSYVVAALADVLRVDETRNALRFGNRVRGVKVDWAVGAAIAHEALLEEERRSVGRGEGEKGERRWREPFAFAFARRTMMDLANAAKRSFERSRGVAEESAFERLGGGERLVGLLLGLAAVFAFVGLFARTSPSDASRANAAARLRLGELKVRRSLGMPSKGGVTSPTKRAAGEDARKGN